MVFLFSFHAKMKQLGSTNKFQIALSNIFNENLFSLGSLSMKINKEIMFLRKTA